jgi:hypothetical protein
MPGRFLLTAGLGIVLASGAFHGSAARAAGQPTGAPRITGSMYNGNNAQPPDLAAHDSNFAAGANQDSPEPQTSGGDNMGGTSDTARAGGGG